MRSQGRLSNQFGTLSLLAISLCLAPGCGSRQTSKIQPPPQVTSSNPAPESSQTSDSTPSKRAEVRSVAPPPRPAPDEPTALGETWKARLSGLELLLSEASEALESGQLERAAGLADQLSRELLASGPQTSYRPEFQLLSEDIDILQQVIQDEKDYLAAEEEFEESTVSEEREPSPLDDIADLNLYQIAIPPELAGRVSADLASSRFDIPIVLNELVLKSLEYFQGRGRAVMEKGLRRSGRYMELFRRVFTEEGLPNDLIYMAQVESLFSPRAYSRARARGIWQFMSGTGRLYGLDIDWWIDERSHVEKSTVAAARHLKDLYKEFQNWELSLAAYNAGPGRVRRVFRRYGKLDFWEMAKRRLLPRETRNHIPSVLAAVIIFKNPEHYGFQVEPDAPLVFDLVNLDYQIDLRVIADTLDISESEISDLNPYLRRGITPQVEGGFELRVPVGTAEKLKLALAEIPPEKRLRTRKHSVQQGDTLWDIARKYGTSVRAISEVNRLRNANRLRLRQELIIPLSDWRAMAGQSRATSAAPPGGKHQVRRGDSLYTIARRYGVTIKQIANWNNINPSATIYPGQQLQVANQK